MLPTEAKYLLIKPSDCCSSLLKRAQEAGPGHGCFTVGTLPPQRTLARVCARPAKVRPPPEPEPSDSEGDVDTAVNFFASHLGNLQRRTLEAKRDSWRNLFR